MLYKYRLPILIAFLVLLADQVLKFWIKLNFYHGESLPIFGEAFTLHFVENEGMAFGWKLTGEYGKIILTSFRIAAVVFIGYYLSILTNKKAPKGLIISISLIFAGALGNIIDSVFYGIIFSASPHNTAEVAQLFPDGGGYATWMHGKVVDMLSFRLFEINVPHAIPLIGGKDFTFFGPIFNIADAAITSGVIMILLFQKRYFKEEPEVVETAPTTEVNPTNTENSLSAPVSSRLVEEPKPYDSPPDQPNNGDEPTQERVNIS